MHSLSLLQTTLNRHHNPFVCSPFLLHEMLSSVDAKLSAALEPASASAARGRDSRALDGSPLRELIFECAQAVARHDLDRSLGILRYLASKVPEAGDAGERVGAYFTRALACRVAKRLEAAGGNGPEGDHSELLASLRIPDAPSQEEIHAAYLALNRVTPFLRFAHLTANQAIVEEMEGEDIVHLVDFEIMQGVQWPPLMQALAERPGGPPHLRLTGIGSSPDILRQTGNRLADFARTLNLPFEFLPLVAGGIEQVSVDMFSKREGEVVAVNCVLQLNRFLEKGPDSLKAFLEMIQTLRPKVVTLAEREANHNQPQFLDRFGEAYRHYAIIFDSLEATLPPRSPDRVTVEEVWFGREIANIVSCDGADWVERHETFEQWREIMESAGFHSLPPSTFALAQAKLLLRYYPSEGYRLFENDDCLLLGWQDHPLFTVSSWH
ncbi:DELLA protein [Marchantia polymorpha subsp. ruderalis]|uniref:Uncharacterized protein n=1 Tax=Marchantia polymorpha TaxID=3197 RepID=A0A2R6X7I1_MARPO|nr:hypothetical protein MARPO_0031s0041 [Marchantia polymorpha]BBN01002.1 hypothetical protein Mp_2g03850 [Marchantia polymorpha subsp. ruderalis]|eukprot:PTQ42051.1 hypothetical protein MARPO_0031s0041 [Marchantia polymorpha]